MIIYIDKNILLYVFCYILNMVITMPIFTKKDLAANQILRNEHIQIFEDDEESSNLLEIGILNLMPKKQDTEIQLLRQLSNTNNKIRVTFINVVSYIPKNTSIEYLEKFYSTFDEIKNMNFDGFIITGAPVEQMDFKDVAYWSELTRIMEWTKSHCKSTLHICWGAQSRIILSLWY